MSFKIGDRVVCIEPFDGNNRCVGLTGTIIALKHKHWDYGVQFDEKFSGGHTCNRKGKDGHCFYGFSSELMPIYDFDESSLELRFDDLL